MDQNSYDEALAFARTYHAGQVRKFAAWPYERPYIEHPIAVADMVMKYFEAAGYEDDDAIVAAILHDVVEDTIITIEDVEREFSANVAKYVWFLSDAPNLIGNRALRNTMTKYRLCLAPDVVKIIKYFDIKHNLVSIRLYDPKFYIVFSKEKAELLETIGIADVALNGVKVANF